MSLLLVAGGAGIVAAEPVFLPPAAVLGERISVTYQDLPAWELAAHPGRQEHRGEGLRMLAPGSGCELAWDGWRLRAGGELVVLAAPWRDVTQDRRWAWLPEIEQPRTALLMEATLPVGDGSAVLPAQIVAAQRIAPAAGVVIELSGQERFAGWRIRDWRLSLAWLVEDLRHRGARRVVILGPAAPAPEQRALEDLSREAATVAAAHGAGWLAGDALSDPALWNGQTLNAAGRAARDRILASVMEPAWTVSSSAPIVPSSSPR